MTISVLARKHGLSRSTLLYYDRIGLLKAGGRLAHGYRHYTPADDARLRQVCLYRRTGLPLAEIRRLLGRPRQDLAAALERQLHVVVDEVEGLRKRQRLIVELLKQRRLLDRIRNLSKDQWVALLRASGFGDADLEHWHRDFEKTDPGYHQRFLEFLGLSAADIRAVREHSRPPAESPQSRRGAVLLRPIRPPMGTPKRHQSKSLSAARPAPDGADPELDHLTSAFPEERIGGTRRVHPYQWLWEPLEDDPTFVLRPMFSGRAAYLAGRLTLYFTARAEPWRGVLVCTERIHHASLLAEFPELAPHPILPKWLYLPETANAFESTGGRLVALARRHDPRLGIEPPKRKSGGSRRR